MDKQELLRLYEKAALTELICQKKASQLAVGGRILKEIRDLAEARIRADMQAGRLRVTPDGTIERCD